MKKPSDHNEYELPDEYDFAGKPARRGRFYSPKKVSVTIRLDDDLVQERRSAFVTLDHWVRQRLRPCPTRPYSSNGVNRMGDNMHMS